MLLIINAFNLVDIMDGLASTIALCCACNFLLIAIFTQQYLPALLLCAMIGSIGAFLCFNRPRASIYLGDAGSLFIGGLFSTIPFLFPWGSINVYGYIIPIIVLAIPLLEVCGLIFIRTYKGLPFYKPSKDHFMHYLKRNHFSEIGILKFIFLMSSILIVSTALFLQNALQIERMIVLGIVFLIYWIYSLAPRAHPFFQK
jgi:UDP-GlcNAc:undecaprenyl-phosphate GlcNAc-1-phosphate transferase